MKIRGSRVPKSAFKCFKKRSYPTKQSAENNSLLGKGGKLIRLRAYECPECGLYHLTSLPEPKPKV